VTLEDSKSGEDHASPPAPSDASSRYMFRVVTHIVDFMIAKTMTDLRAVDVALSWHAVDIILNRSMIPRYPGRKRSCAKVGRILAPISPRNGFVLRHSSVNSQLDIGRPDTSLALVNIGRAP
jgi:hypothetical protein